MDTKLKLKAPEHLVLGIVGLLSLIHLGYSVLLLLKHGQQKYFVIRGILLEWGFLASSTIVMMILYPTLELMRAFDIPSNKYDPVLQFLITLFTSYSSITLVGRALLRYMAIRRNDSKIGWKSALDSNYSKKIPKYYHIFGKQKKVFIFATIIWTIESIFGLISLILFNSVTFWLTIILFLNILQYLILFYCVFSKSGRNFNDYWGLSIELKRIVFISLGCTFLSVLASLLDDQGILPTYMRLQISHAIIVYFWNHLMWFVSIDWVVYYNRKKNTNWHVRNESRNPDTLAQWLQTETGKFYR